MDWLHSLIGQGPDNVAWWQVCVRAIFIFLYGLILIRIGGLRAFGRQTPLDIVVAVIMGSNLSRALTGNAPFLPTLAATAALVALHWLLARATPFSHALGWLLKGSPVWLVRDGKRDENAATRNGVTAADLEEAMRSCGIGHHAEMETAVLERSGKISVIRRKGA